MLSATCLKVCGHEFNLLFVKIYILTKFITLLWSNGYNDGVNRLKWTGTEENLNLEFVKDIEGCSREKWEEDRLHNILMCNASRIVFKWYSSTKTVHIQRKDHLELKTKLLNIAEVFKLKALTNKPMFSTSIIECILLATTIARVLCGRTMYKQHYSLRILAMYGLQKKKKKRKIKVLAVIQFLIKYILYIL